MLNLKCFQLKAIFLPALGSECVLIFFCIYVFADEDPFLDCQGGALEPFVQRITRLFQRVHFQYNHCDHVKSSVTLSSVQLLSHVRLFATSWTTAHQASLSFTISQSLLKLVSIELLMPCNHLILCRPLLLPSSIFPSIKVFSNESVLHIRWPKYWSFSFSISPSNGDSGLITFRIDWLDLLPVQGTLKSLLQHHSLKPSILQCSAFL